MWMTDFAQPGHVPGVRPAERRAAASLSSQWLGLVLDEARRNGSRLPLTALVDQFYADVQALGGNRWDTSSLIKRL